MRATALLRRQHRQVRDLLKTADHTEDAEGRRRLVDRLTWELKAHWTIEEELFYPAVRSAGTGKAEAAIMQAMEEHHVVDVILGELPGVDPEDERFVAKMRVLSDLVEDHIRQEEQALFKLAQKLGRGELTELGRQMEARAGELESADRRAA